MFYNIKKSSQWVCHLHTDVQIIIEQGANVKVLLVIYRHCLADALRRKTLYGIHAF
jgi:hypothetical protein